MHLILAAFILIIGIQNVNNIEHHIGHTGKKDADYKEERF